MAAQITHALSGEAALRVAEAERGGAAAAERRLEAHGAAFRLGCQGPDLFYHGQRSRPVSISLGTLVHRRDSGRLARSLVASAAPGGRGSGDPAWAAFVLGYLSHAPVDRRTHPFIVWFSGWHDPARPSSLRYAGCHAFLERGLDASLLAERLGLLPRQWSIAERLLPPGGVPASFAPLLAACMREAYPERLAQDDLLERRVENAFADSEGFYRFTDPASISLSQAALAPWASLDPEAGRRAIAVLYPEGGLGDLDIANRRHRPWAHPCDPGLVRTSDYAELVAEAEADARAILARALAMIDGAEPPSAEALDALERLVGPATLNVGDAEGRACKPLACAPLPLSELMEAEFRVRRDKLPRKPLRERG